jgi:hypothetical protein
VAQEPYVNGSMVGGGPQVQASEFSKTTQELVNGISSNPLDREPAGRADLEASKHGKSDEDSAHDHFNELQSLHGDTVRTPAMRSFGGTYHAVL